MNQPKQSKALVLWIIWASMSAAIVIYQFVLGHGIPTGQNDTSIAQSPVLYLAGLQLVAAAAVRWLMIPKAKAPGKVLVLLIFGLAISEAVEFYGLFLVPPEHHQTKLILWILALISVFQFAPIYAKGEDSESIPA